MTAAAALDTAARVGEFFTLDRLPTEPDWLPLRELVRNPAALDRRITAARRTIAHAEDVEPDAVPLRTTASVDLLGLSARVLAPALGAAALAGVVPALTVDRLRFRHSAPGFAVTEPIGRTVTTMDQAADALHADVITPVLVPLVEVYAERFRLSRKVLWGNVASALSGSADVLAASGRPQVLQVRDIVAALLRTQLLQSTARSLPPRFVRNSCCLYYRIPGAALCGDCLLSAQRPDAACAPI